MAPPPPTPREEFLRLYGRPAWQDWERLRAHFDLGEGFSLLVLLLPGAVGARVCHDELAEYLAAKGKTLLSLPCLDRELVKRLPQGLFDLATGAEVGGAWIGSVIPATDPEIELWREAWGQGLALLNQQRNPLRRMFSYPLVFVGAPWLAEVLREAAPDVWSVRTAVVRITPSPPEQSPLPSPAGQTSPAEQFGPTAAGEHAADPDYALEQAERLRERPELDASRASLLWRAGNGFRVQVRWRPAERAFQEAVSLYRRLCERDGDRHESDLAGVLNNLGNVQRDLGDREAALASYTEALEIYQALARKWPAAFEQYLVTVLRNYTGITDETDDDPWWQLWRQRSAQADDADTP